MPEIEEMIKIQEKKVKESVADPKQVKALQSKISSIDKGKLYSLYFVAQGNPQSVIFLVCFFFLKND